MAIDTARTRRLLADFAFRDLFVEELGWEKMPGRPLRLAVGGEDFELRPVAEKRGMVVLLWEAPEGRALPDRATRLKIYRELSKLHFEHILICADAAHTVQEWTWVRREPGKPLAPRVAYWRAGQTNDALIQKLGALAFGIEQEEDLTLTDVTRAARKALDVERVAKQFYDRFQKEHAAFLTFVRGIAEQGDREWYVSVMLNRLMFVYFIQKKGFLDDDLDYLRHRLTWVREQYGTGSFHSFYRGFLLTLFHEGLGSSTHSPEVKRLLGRVPYLNGGLFDLHQLEREHPDIEIADEAFERVFAFFDDFQWHLDDRPSGKGNEINPDVLGYIFEKYINQKQMGAYYTKEDITEYIGKNTILPFLFDAARRRCEVAFRPEGVLWGLLRENPDRYLYAPVKQGVIDDAGTVIPLPPEIEAGVSDISKRSGWNRPAGAPYGLPTETWREHVARRTRALELREKLRAGTVHEINDLVTYNLDIRQFAEDVIFNSEGPELLRAFWYALAGRVPLQSHEKPEAGITVLDPTCGSGAFLFAALGILQPLYDACLARMRLWVEEADAAGGDARKFHDFREILTRVDDRRHHPSHAYFVLKSIILNNLFGVDIMAEAVEICKLRLFLKLVAQVERMEDVEPLPDIDFNIRAGNTLVGFATLGEVRRAVEGDAQAELMLGDKSAVLQRIAEDAETVDRAYRLFQQMQTRQGMDAAEFHEAKGDLRERLTKLDEELNRYLAKEYGVNPEEPKEYAKWKESHQPFHWFVDFYGIMSRGGFDVIIGNPPYISAAKVRKQYILQSYETAQCSDVYANVLERTANLLNVRGRSGMIVPLSITFSSDFDSLRKLLHREYGANWFSSFARIPAALFGGDVRVRNTIHLGSKDKGEARAWNTVLHRWFEQARSHLFDNLAYVPFTPKPYKGLIPKTNTERLARAFERQLASTSRTVANSLSRWHTKHILHYKKSAYNWLNFCREQPPCYDALGREIAHTKFGTEHFDDVESRDLAFLLLNGKLMFAFWCMMGDDFDVTKWMFADFPVDLSAIPPEQRARLLPLAEELEELMQKNVSFKLNAGKRVGNYNLARCRVVTDRSDAIFAEHLGMTDVLPDIELMYAQLVKTSFDDADAE